MQFLIPYLKRTYGNDQNIIESAIQYGILSENVANFRQENFLVWDLETLESEDEVNTNIQVDGVLKVASIGVASSFGMPEKYFERKSSDPEHSIELVSDFLDYVFEAEQLFYNTIPEEIRQVEHDLEFAEAKCEKVRVRKGLKKYTTMPIFGYNSCKYYFLIIDYDS